MRHSHPIRLAFVAGALGLAAPTPARGAGFQLNEHSARQTGMASSVVATVKDPSAIFYNPAGLTQIEGTAITAGSSAILAHGKYTGPGLPGTNDTGGDVTNQLGGGASFVPYVYAARQLSDKAYLGLGFYLPYNSGLAWEPENEGDPLVGRTHATELALRTYFFTPTVALELDEAISIAVGVSLVPATLLLRRELGDTVTQEPLFSSGSSVELSGSAFGVGATAGIQIKLIDHLRIGLTYRSAVDLSFSGDGNFTLPEDATASLRERFPDQGVTGDVTLPHTFALGIGWVQGGLTVELGSQLTLWESYDELRINFETGNPAESSVSRRDWENVAMFRLGVEYDFGGLALRVGGGYDMSPVPDSTADFTLSDNDRIFGSLGLGYDFGPIRVDAGYMALWITEREIDTAENINLTTGGTFEGGMAHVASLSLGTQF